MEFICLPIVSPLSQQLQSPNKCIAMKGLMPSFQWCLLPCRYKADASLLLKQELKNLNLPFLCTELRSFITIHFSNHCHVPNIFFKIHQVWGICHHANQTGALHSIYPLPHLQMCYLNPYSWKEMISGWTIHITSSLMIHMFCVCIMYSHTYTQHGWRQHK